MAVRTFTVYCEWDPEAKVWYVSDSNVPGLVAEAPNPEAMTALLERRVPELLELNCPEACADLDNTPLELLIHARQRLPLRCN